MADRLGGIARRLTRRTGSEAADGADRPAVAVITVARDEALMLPRWVRYYGDQVGVENLVVLDDGSTDGGTDELPCTVHRLPGFRAGAFESGRMGLASGIAAGLLHSYDAVIFTDTDEFLVADPRKYAGLRDYVARTDADVIAPLTLNVLQVPAVEGQLDPDAPVIGQRQFAKFIPLMCKPALKRIPAAWSFASHGIAAPYAVDRELFMLHLKFADLDVLRRQAQLRNDLAVSSGRGSGSSWQHSGDEMAAMIAEFVGDADPAQAAPFRPRAIDTDTLVVPAEDGRFRAPQQSQVGAMKRRPLVRIPEFLHGVV